MARPQQNIIETFMSITGASEAVAYQKIEEHGGNLNQAINAHFNEDDRSTIHPSVLPPQDDFMAIDDLIEDESGGPSRSFSSAVGSLDAVAPLDPKYGPSLFDGGGSAEGTGHAPQVSKPEEVREVPTRFKDGSGQSGHSGLNPSVEDVTGSAHAHAPEVDANLIIDDEDLAISTPTLAAQENERTSDEGHPVPSVPQFDNAADNGDDIEEEMLRAAIEASKREVAGRYPDQQFSIPYDSSGSRFVQGSSHSDDFEFARAVSMSLKTAEQEKALREGSAGTEEHRVSHSYDVEESGAPAAENGRQEFGSPTIEASSQFTGEGNSSAQEKEEAEDVEEQPLVRHRSRRISFGASSGAAESAKQEGEMVDSLPSSPLPHDITSHPQPNGDAFHSDEWGGISSEEHDDAVMLEAAIFGGIPEGNAYHRFAYPLHDALHTGLDRNVGPYPRLEPRPPSPTLVAQRLLREQQDDEYLAALRADAEKELKAREDAEIRRVEEAAAREALLQEERHREEETRRKLLEEEEFERMLAEKEASLPSEPAADDETAITLLVRMPDGSRRGRRFLKSDKLQLLFHFIDIGRGVKPGTYRLVRPYPRRAFSDCESGLSFNDLGLSSKQEALFLELI